MRTYNFAVRSLISQNLSMIMRQLPKYLLVMPMDFILKSLREKRMRKSMVMSTLRDSMIRMASYSACIDRIYTYSLYKYELRVYNIK